MCSYSILMCSYETLSILMCKVLVSKACTTIKRKVCQVPPPQKDTKSSRELAHNLD